MSDFTGVIGRQAAQPTSGATFLLSFLLWWSLLLFFGTFPAIDIAVARFFFTESECHIPYTAARVCGTFGYDREPVFSLLRSILFQLPYAAVVVLIGSIVHSKLTDAAGWKSRRIEMSFAALISLALGCGLIVNLFLKMFSGRPRPRETSLFGGTLDFVHAGSFAGKCIKNCSFVSGEASSAGWLLCLIVLLPPRWRLHAGIPLALISFAVPILRMITGAHYLSDAVLGWLSSIVIFMGVVAVMETISGRKYFSDQ
jgi:membrane-associated phospholipid phosphatase